MVSLLKLMAIAFASLVLLAARQLSDSDEGWTGCNMWVSTDGTGTITNYDCPPGNQNCPNPKVCFLELFGNAQGEFSASCPCCVVNNGVATNCSGEEANECHAIVHRPNGNQAPTVKCFHFHCPVGTPTCPGNGNDLVLPANLVQVQPCNCS